MTAQTNTWFDYTNQAWVCNGVYKRCGHPEKMDCGCYGRVHEGETPAPTIIEQYGTVQAQTLADAERAYQRGSSLHTCSGGNPCAVCSANGICQAETGPGQRCQKIVPCTLHEPRTGVIVYLTQVNATDPAGWVPLAARDMEGAAIKALRTVGPRNVTWPCTVYVGDPDPKLNHQNGTPLVVHAFTLEMVQHAPDCDSIIFQRDCDCADTDKPSIMTLMSDQDLRNIDQATTSTEEQREAAQREWQRRHPPVQVTEDFALETTLSGERFAVSYGKLFQITDIVDSVERANEICGRNSHIGVIGQHDGMIYLAETAPLKELPPALDMRNLPVRRVSIRNKQHPEWGTWGVMEDRGGYYEIHGERGGRVLDKDEAVKFWEVM